MRRIRNFIQRGGPGPTAGKQSGQRRFFFLLFFIVLNLFYS